MPTMTNADGQAVSYIKQAQDIVAKAEQENRDVNSDEMAQLDSLVKQAQAWRDGQERSKKSKSTLSQIEQLVTPEMAEEINAGALEGAKGGMPERLKSPAERLLKSDAFKSLMERHAIDGRIPDSAKGIQSGAISLGGLKALITGADRDTSAGVFVQSQNLGYLPFALPDLNLRDVITVGQTQSDTVEWVQQLRVGSGSVNAAKGVPEATDVASAPTKPESTVKFAKRKSTVETIAHWLPITKRALSDAGQVRTIIDQFLSRGIDERVEEYILNGDSDSEGEWDGLLNTSGTQSQTWDTDLITTSRRAISKVRTYGRPTGVLVSPGTSERLDLAKDANGRYLGSGPWSTGPATLWSLPRIEVRGLPDDKFIVGDLRTAVLWDRESTTITVSDSHADFFVKNLLAILAEARAAFGVLDPALLVVGEIEDAA